MPSYYFPHLTKHSSEITLENEEFHHLSRVKRIGPGALIKINGGNGLLADCKVLELDKRRARLIVMDIRDIPLPEPAFSLAFALLKNHHDELVVEKCTELGAVEFFPMITEYTVRDQGRNTHSRFEKIALAAIKQCDNPRMPLLHPALPIEQALEAIRSRGYEPVVCSEIEKQIWLNDIDIKSRPCFIVGPEGGFSESEHVLFKGFSSICLSRLIMRAETAAICVSAQYQHMLESRQSSQSHANDTNAI